MQHRGTDGVDIDHLDIYWDDGQLMYCRRKDNGDRNIGFFDNNDVVDLVCSPP